MKTVAILAVSIALMLSPAFAQDLPPMERAEKEPSNMDSRLVDLYEQVITGDMSGANDSAVPLSSDGTVRVILEMVSVDAPIPQGLGIEVETSYENLVQALVPVRNLEAIASDQNVLVVRLPSTPVPGMVQPAVGDDFAGMQFDIMWVLVPAIVIPAMAVVFVWKRKSRK